MILIKYSNGLVHQGVVLSFGDLVMRVAIKGCDDAAEFRMNHGVWVSEDCEIAHFEFTGHGFPIEIEGDDFLEKMLISVAAALPVQRVM